MSLNFTESKHYYTKINLSLINSQSNTANYLDSTVISLYQGALNKNILTVNKNEIYCTPVILSYTTKNTLRRRSTHIHGSMPEEYENQFGRIRVNHQAGSTLYTGQNSKLR